MTVGAGRPFSGMATGVDREPGVIEHSAGPCRRVVARGTSRRESGCDVIRIRHTGVIRFVTRVAIGWRSGISSADVATHALHVHMCARQRERRLAVIEVSRSPRGSAVAQLAGLGKSCRNVIRVCGAVEIRKMAR